MWLSSDGYSAELWKTENQKVHSTRPPERKLQARPSLNFHLHSCTASGVSIEMSGMKTKYHSFNLIEKSMRLNSTFLVVIYCSETFQQNKVFSPHCVRRSSWPQSAGFLNMCKRPDSIEFSSSHWLALAKLLFQLSPSEFTTPNHLSSFSPILCILNPHTN